MKETAEGVSASLATEVARTKAVEAKLTKDVVSSLLDPSTCFPFSFFHFRVLIVLSSLLPGVDLEGQNAKPSEELKKLEAAHQREGDEYDARYITVKEMLLALE